MTPSQARAVAAALRLAEREARRDGAPIRQDLIALVEQLQALGQAGEAYALQAVAEFGSSLDLAPAAPVRSAGSWLSVPEAAKRHCLPERTVRAWCAQGIVEAERRGWTWLVDAQSIQQQANRRDSA